MNELTDDSSEEYLFMMLTSTKVPLNPCLLCPKAEANDLCAEILDCKAFHAYQAYRKQRKKQLSTDLENMDRSICTQCPVHNACPIAFTDAITWCKVKDSAVQIQKETERYSNLFALWG